MEFAGLVMAVFPLVVEGIKLYSQAMETLRGAREYSSKLYQYSVDLGVEQAKFNQTWTRILQLSNLSSAESEDTDPWQLGPNNSTNLQKILCSSLRNCTPDVKQRFEVALGNLSERLAEVKRDFEIEVTKIPDRRSAKKLLKMLKTELNSKYRNEKLSEIRKGNIDIDMFVDGEYQMQMYQMQLRAVAARAQTPKGTGATQTKHYNIVQKQATAMYRVLQQTLPPGICCKMPHSAGLELEFRGPAKSSNSSSYINQNEFTNQRCRFKFHLTLDDFPRAQQSDLCELECEMLTETHIMHAPMSTQTPTQPTATCTTAIKVGMPIASGSAVNLTTAHQCKIPPKRVSGPVSALKRVSFTKALRWKDQSPASTHVPPTPAQTSVPTSVFVQANAQAKLLSEIRVSTPSILLSKDGTTPQGTVLPSDQLCTTCTLSNNKPFSCLCSTIQRCLNEICNPQTACLGVLKGSMRVCPRGQMSHGIAFQSRRVISLHSLLHQTGGEGISPVPSTASRLRLGVILASSAMQLHESNWLSDRWSSADILFNGTLPNQVDSADLHKPFVQRPLTHSTSEETKAILDERWDALSTFCNPILFSLGIVLIEVFHWKPISMLQGELSPSQAIMKILTKLCDLAGARYESAVRRCIRGLDGREMNFTDQGFKKDVYAKIVYPLEENLKNWYGVEDVQEIFEKEG